MKRQIIIDQMEIRPVVSGVVDSLNTSLELNLIKSGNQDFVTCKQMFLKLSRTLYHSSYQILGITKEKEKINFFKFWLCYE